VARAIVDAPDLELVGAVSRSAADQRASVILDRATSVVISGSVAEALERPTDVFVDYTSALAVKAHVLTAIDRGLHVVVGSSGLSEDDFADIDTRARTSKCGVVAVANFAVPALVFELIAVSAAQHLPDWEVLDFATNAKIDAPSGMTRQLAAALTDTPKPAESSSGRHTTSAELPEARGASLFGSRIHSVRLPGHVIGAEIHYGQPHQRLSIRYEGGASAEPYVEGTLAAIRKVPVTVGLTRGPRAIFQEMADERRAYRADARTNRQRKGAR
jgi:4-hydroxy-tetrahydrodipicolinate reductase